MIAQVGGIPGELLAGPLRLESGAHRAIRTCRVG